MVFNEHEITVKGKQQQILLLDNDIEARSKQLTDTIQKKDSISKEMSDFYEERSLFEIEKREFKDKYLKKEKDLAIRLADYETQKTESLDILNTRKEELKESTRKLDKINSQCIGGQKEIEKLNIDIVTLNEQIEKLAWIVVHVEETKTNLKVLQEEFERANQALVSTRTLALEEVRFKEETLRKLGEDVVIMEKRRDQAEFELKSYVSQLSTAMNDYYVVKLRLESHWKRTFPELDVPLAL